MNVLCLVCPKLICMLDAHEEETAAGAGSSAQGKPRNRLHVRRCSPRAESSCSMSPSTFREIELLRCSSGASMPASAVAAAPADQARRAPPGSPSPSVRVAAPRQARQMRPCCLLLLSALCRAAKQRNESTPRLCFPVLPRLRLGLARCSARS